MAPGSIQLNLGHPTDRPGLRDRAARHLRPVNWASPGRTNDNSPAPARRDCIPPAARDRSFPARRDSRYRYESVLGQGLDELVDFPFGVVDVRARPQSPRADRDDDAMLGLKVRLNRLRGVYIGKE